WARITALPGTGDGFHLYVRLQSPGSSAAGGYRLRAERRSGTDQVFLQRMTDGAVTTLATFGRELATGDTFVLRARGSTLEAWARSGSTWTKLGSAADSTYSGPGRVGVGIDDKQCRLDDFGARSLP
ncbi:MAG TPA: hypothetical protein VK896_04055, partial [Gaiellaceae bacterium]|nr:hypothetical protein [Gaiellaceae bacterium]